MGRTAKTAAAKALGGNAGRRAPKKSSVQVHDDRQKAPSPPDWLSNPVAREQWCRLWPDLKRASILTGGALDEDELATYCLEFSRYITAQKVLDEKGTTYATETGYERPRPEVSIAEKARRACERGREKLGMTPRAWAELAGKMASTGRQLLLPGLDIPKAEIANDQAPPTEEETSRAFFGY